MSRMLDNIKEPKDLKKFKIDQLPLLAKEIRKYLVQVISENGGHLSPNLGTVELTIALHYCFNSPVDKIIWDVGHQSYVHKILTGRKEDFKTIRQYKGLSGFPKRDESPHDAFDAGHSSTSISAALGYSYARDLKNENNYVLSIIGDGALSGGLAFEALNNAARIPSNFIVILNDNQMSISKNVGAMSVYLDSIRTGHIYNGVKEDIQKVLRKIPKYGEEVINTVRDIKDSVKQLIIPGMFFEELGFTYLGPIDGHNIKQLIKTLNQAKKVDGPILVHINTIKGKGYKYAEKYPAKFHGVKPFEIKSGVVKRKANNKTYSEIFGESLINIASNNEKVVAITAAMPDGTGLTQYAKKFPQRFFDVGIAEQHAVTFAGGLAAAGLKPFVAVYSTFLQRAYDQIVHDICMQKLPVVFAIDRSGLVGADGETHQGVFDVSYLSHIPNLTLVAPKDGQELKTFMAYASNYDNGPIAIKYPRGTDVNIEINRHSPIDYGKSEIIFEGKEIAIIFVGSMYETAYEVYRNLEKDGKKPTLVNTRFIKPMDTDLFEKLANEHDYMIVIEENLITGGFGSEVIRLINEHQISCHVKIFGINDQYVEHGDRATLLDINGLSAHKIYHQIKTLY